MEFKAINIVHILIIWQSLLFAVVLLTPKYNRRNSNKFLSLLLFTLGIHFTYNVLYSNGYLLDILPAYSCTYGYLYGPFLYLHIKFYLQEDVRFKFTYWVHFLPVAIIILTTAFGYSICNIAGIWILPVMLLYTFLGFREIVRYEKAIQQVSSGNYAAQTKWLQSMLIVMIVIVVLNMIQSQANNITIARMEISMEAVVQIGVLLLVNIIIYQGLKNPLLFQQISESDLELVKLSGTNDRGTSTNEEVLKNIANKLEEYFKRSKPYKDPTLNLNMVADAIQTPSKTVSQSINLIIGCNFAEYINTQRIDDARKLLEKKSDSELSIKEIMYEVGFNSRSVFNTVFKSQTGHTPTQYRELHKKNNA